MQLSEGARKQQRFICVAISVLVVFWFVCCISLYWSSPVYQLQIGQLYESRWLLSSLAVNVFFTYLFLYSPSVILFSALFVCTQYTIIYCAISFFVYVIDSLNISAYSIESRHAEIVQYLRISLTLIFLSLLGFILSILHLRRLVILAWRSQQCAPIAHRRLIQCCSALHGALALFSIYVCSETISFKTTYVQSYTMQQLCCALLALILALLQGILQTRCNPLITTTIAIMNICQLAQELAHAWNAYYVCIYIKSLAAHVGDDLFFDQVMISITLLVHGFRLVLCALVIAALCRIAFDEEMNRHIVFKPDPERLISISEVSQASRADECASARFFYAAATLSVAYIFVDVGYFCMRSARRTLTASTGISLFYAFFIALSFHLYRKRRIAIALKVCSVFAIVLCNSALHTIYMFGQELLLGSLSEKMFSSRSNALLHGADIFLALFSAVLAIKSLRFDMRTVLLHHRLLSQPSCINGPLKMLNYLANINILTVAFEFSLILVMKFGWRMSDPAVNFGVLDWISVLSTCVLQKWVCMYERYQSCLIVLVLQLVVECLTTLSFLSAQTNYIQLMLSLARSRADIDKLRQLLPIDHIIIVLTDHGLQVLQWAVALCSLGFSLVVLDEVVTERDPDTPAENRNEASRVDGLMLTGVDNVLFENDTVHILSTGTGGE
uniref:G protein-coupled receptor n=1 Tax=Ascaris lumbricoides TaxID=6252 RepID=A0A0M3I257_ASCLU